MAEENPDVEAQIEAAISPEEEKANVTEDDLKVYDHFTDPLDDEFSSAVQVDQMNVVKTPAEEKTCCKKCCQCYPLGDNPDLDEQIMTDDEIKAAMKENLEGMLQPEFEAIMKYSKMRATYNGPYTEFWEDAIEEDENFRDIFSISQMTSRVWTDNTCTDLWLFSLQKHPLLGFMSHHTHPLELADRTMIFLTGFCICLINQIAPLCERDLCDNSCFHLWVDNGVCEDGGNFTWAGKDSVYNYPGDTEDFPNMKVDGPYACDYGTDCLDCGPRDTMWLRRAGISKGDELWNDLPGDFNHPDGPGLWCFSNNQVYVKTVAMTFCIIPVSFTVITNLLLCKCCITQDDVAKKIFWTDFGQNLGNCIVMALVTFAGYLTKTYIDKGVNFLVLLANKTFVFALIGGINVLVFMMSYKSNKEKIYKFKGMRNFIRANYTLNGALDSASKVTDVKSAKELWKKAKKDDLFSTLTIAG